MIKKDFKRDDTKKRDDSPLRFEATVHCFDWHEGRISFLRHENEYMFQDLITAKLFLAIATIKRNSKNKAFTDLAEYQAVKEATQLWQYCLDEEEASIKKGMEEWETENELKLIIDNE